MTSSPDLDDLRLVDAVHRLGSIGGAARALAVSQPSASSRLARLERRAGVVLFHRDTTGARPTPAGTEMARTAARIIGQVSEVFDDARRAMEYTPLRVGTIHALCAVVFPAVETLLDRVVTPTVDHGPPLVEAVAAGHLDAAVVAVADQVTLPRTVRVHPLGEDVLMLFRHAQLAPLAAGREPFARRRVVYSTYDMHGPLLHDRLERLGATAAMGASLATTIALTRARRCLATIPHSAVSHDLHADEVLEPLPFTMRVRVSLVTGRGVADDLVARAIGLSAALRLHTR